mmetsp:Transcript_25560/g.39587  ORF Transcript_25560/g.39587 Transcript_25560/m.39587 type:complete len:425 (+) Transcript_25560:165-1439(+)
MSTDGVNEDANITLHCARSGLPPLVRVSNDYQSTCKTGPTSPIAAESCYNKKMVTHPQDSKIAKRWKVALPLRSVPRNYALAWGFCTTFIPNTDGNIIADRMQSYLRLQSIHAIFNEQHANAFCKSMDRVTFGICLFSGRGDYAHGVIVEMRRYSGDSLAFFRYRCAIMRIVQAKVLSIEEVLVKANGEKVNALPLPAIDVDDEEEDKYLCKLALEDVLCLLKEDKHGPLLLAMQSLCNLTDAAKSGSFIAQDASIRLLSDSEGDERLLNAECTGGVIMEYLKKCLETDRQSTLVQNDEIIEQNHIEDVRHLALHVLKNVMSNLRCEHVLLKDKFVCSLTPVLIEEVRHASDRPHNAYFAMSCLNSMLKYSSGASNMNIKSTNLKLLLMKAFSVGKSSHACLEEATARVLRRLKYFPKETPIFR